MPYDVEKRGTQWVVLKRKSGKQVTMGKHATEEAALKQVAALHAAEDDKESPSGY